MKLKQNTCHTLVFILIFLSISGNSLGQVNKELLIGKWLFVTFDFPKSTAETPQFILESNEKYKDVIYIITKDNKFIMQKRNGGQNWNKQTTFKLVQNKYLQLAVGQKMRIDYLDTKMLKIFVEGHEPVGIFKRIK